jgi:hypothetical protein
MIRFLKGHGTFRIMMVWGGRDIRHDLIITISSGSHPSMAEPICQAAQASRKLRIGRNYP